MSGVAGDGIMSDSKPSNEKERPTASPPSSTEGQGDDKERGPQGQGKI
jgi:hypothetical protein